ncbi:MAG: HEAT repeat domain-containing protein [Candidatus Micrarchaeota archaeon]
MDFTAHLESLKDEKPQARIDAVKALAGIGQPAVGSLCEMAAEASLPAHARACAVKALGAIGGAEAAEALIKALGDGEVVVRIPAAMHLGALKEKKAAPNLAQMLGDWSSIARGCAADSLCSLAEACASADELMAMRGTVAAFAPKDGNGAKDAERVLGKMAQKADSLLCSEPPSHGNAAKPHAGGNGQAALLKVR